MAPDNDWPEFKRLVLHRLEQQHKDHAEVQAALTAIQVQLATLKARAGVWGAAAGILPALAALLYSLVR
jgi:hypothetical protein